METTWKTIEAVIMAVVIAALCVLPPIVHFVTGPLGPLIGGYFAGSRFRLSGGQAAIVGLLLGLVVGLPAPLVLTELGLIHNLAPLTLWFFAGFAGIYFAVLGGAAAWFGGSSARSDDRITTAD